eukprot:Selendium_serpulae@DN11986_c0_g1_i1.p1
MRPISFCRLRIQYWSAFVGYPLMVSPFGPPYTAPSGKDSVAPIANTDPSDGTNVKFPDALYLASSLRIWVTHLDSRLLIWRSERCRPLEMRRLDARNLHRILCSVEPIRRAAKFSRRRFEIECEESTIKLPCAEFFSFLQIHAGRLRLWYTQFP